MIGTHAHNRKSPARMVGAWDTVGIASVLVALLAITAADLTAGQFWEHAALPRAPWCHVGEVPTFQFGFDALAQAIGNVMGTPTECEHGEDSSDNTFQATTTGVATYDWCTNTPRFTRGNAHWMLTPEGVMHWTENADPPGPLPVVRAPDLRHLCLR
jgi:hypothetical protein